LVQVESEIRLGCVGRLVDHIHVAFPWSTAAPTVPIAPASISRRLASNNCLYRSKSFAFALLFLPRGNQRTFFQAPTKPEPLLSKMHTTNTTLAFFAPFPTIAKPELIFFIQAICRPVRSRKRKENQRNRLTSSARWPGLGVVSKLRRRRHLCAEEFTYLRARTQRIAKVTLPSPSL